MRFDPPGIDRLHPARRNPHADRVRARITKWAKDIGMVGSPGPGPWLIWDQASFAAEDHTGRAAYVVPDCDAGMFELQTAWVTWGLYIDDYVHRFKLRPDLEEAARQRDRLHRIASATEPHEFDVQGPVEAGLADLWEGTAPGRSAAWVRRFAQATRRYIDGCTAEVAAIGRARAADPIDYFAARRNANGNHWLSMLVELSHGVELPERLVDTRPVNVLRDYAFDAFAMHNDLASYEREVGSEGELNNGVAVLSSLVGTDETESARLLDELDVSRLRQFDFTARVELPPARPRALHPHGSRRGPRTWWTTPKCAATPSAHRWTSRSPAR